MTVIDTLAIIGCGLIGSSIIHAAKQNNSAKTIYIYDYSAEARQLCREHNIGDVVCDNLQDCVQNADMIILCTPVGTYAEIAKQIMPYLKPNTILSDVGSVKGAVVKAITPFLRDDIHFIPAHPIAGTEKSGPLAGFATLFQNRWCIITPINDNEPFYKQKLKEFWQSLGSMVDEMDIERHDLVLAITSHLPHLIAYNIVGTADHLEKVSEQDVIKFSASGFRDFTRIAASDPTMWRDVFLNNKDAVIEMLGRFVEDLFELQRAIRYGDGQKLYDHFARTRLIRKGIVEAGQDTDSANFGRK
jgi:cyclohexadieny/prephenate dehydrogenase